MTAPAPRPLLVNTYDHGGGAAIAALRLHRGLRDLGLESRLLVQSRRSREPGVLGPSGPLARAASWARPRLESLPVRQYARRRPELFSPSWLTDHLERDVAALAPDLVHLHWIAHGFVRIETLARFRQPLVWTLHDSWAFTGGCHLPLDCTRYRDACGACPALGSGTERDLSRQVWERKRAAWRERSFTIVTPSRWLAGCVRSSALLSGARCEVIPNGLDLARFRPADAGAVRDRLRIAPGRVVLLCGGAGIARDANKGLPLLAAALRAMSPQERAGLEVLVFGTEPGDPLPDAGMPVRDLGYVRGEDELAALYSAADLFVTPSLQENLPNTIMEAMACGTPCVAFDVGGVGELVEHQRTGWLARAGDAADLGRGIAWLLEDGERRRQLGASGRARMEGQFEIGAVARRHADLYRELLAGDDRARAGRGGTA